jgi:transcriptional regulator with XRE-family HTH domain
VLQIKAKIPDFARRRIVSGYSQRELARKAELSSAFVSQLESGKRNTSPDAANRICLELGADFDELFEIMDRSNEVVLT